LDNNNCTCPLCNQSFTPTDGMTADEHLARGVLGLYTEMQSINNTLPCPRCGENSMSHNVLKNALSGQFDVRVCDICGNREGVEAAEGKLISLESWWVVTEILNDRRK